MRTDPDPDCEWCAGSGVVATDEDDGEGHTARGVGDDRPCLCTKTQEFDRPVEVHICHASDMHPYNCDGQFGGACEHCERKKTDDHDPATCALCDPEYDFMPNDVWIKEENR